MWVLFARVLPARKLTVEASGCAIPAGKTMRSPCAVGFTTVTFAETATAPEGTPHVFVRTNVRCAAPPRDGPPRGPAVLRVSRRRQGVSGWSVVAAETGGGGGGA